MNTTKVTIRAAIVAILVLGTLAFEGRRILIKRDVTVADTSTVTVGMSIINVRWQLGAPHHMTESSHHKSWWWTYSERGGAPAKYFNVVFKLGSVVQVADAADFTKPQPLRDDEAPLPKKKVGNQP